MQLQEATKPLTIFSQIFGVAPVLCGKLGDLSVPLSLLLLAFCIGTTVTFLRHYWLHPEYTLQMYIFQFAATGITFSHAIHRLAYLRNRLYVSRMMGHLQLIQMSLGSDWDYRKAYWCSAALLLINGFLIASYGFVRWGSTQDGPYTVSNYLSPFTVYLVELQFVGIVHVLQQLFKQVNEAVARNRKDVRHLMQLHGQLCDAAQEIMDEFGLPMIVNLSFSFGALITSLYYFVLGLMSASRANNNIRILNYISWFWPVFRIPSLWFKLWTCHLAAYEANHTAVLVHRRLIDEQEMVVRHELELFSMQLLHRKLRFTAGGFVTLDLTLFQSIVSAVTTYLIILIQFQLL